MAQVVAHQGVQDVVVLEEMHAVLHEVVDELAQDDLLRDLSLQPQQPRIDLPYRLVSQKHAEVCLGDENPGPHLAIDESSDDGDHVDGQGLELRKICLFCLDALDQFVYIFPMVRKLPGDQVKNHDPQRK
jgi:hypothetical protein